MRCPDCKKPVSGGVCLGPHEPGVLDRLVRAGAAGRARLTAGNIRIVENRPLTVAYIVAQAEPEIEPEPDAPIEIGAWAEGSRVLLRLGADVFDLSGKQAEKLATALRKATHTRRALYAGGEEGRRS